MNKKSEELDSLLSSFSSDEDDPLGNAEQPIGHFTGIIASHLPPTLTRPWSFSLPPGFPTHSLYNPPTQVERHPNISLVQSPLLSPVSTAFQALQPHPSQTPQPQSPSLHLQPIPLEPQLLPSVPQPPPPCCRLFSQRGPSSGNKINGFSDPPASHISL